MNRRNFLVTVAAIIAAPIKGVNASSIIRARILTVADMSAEGNTVHQWSRDEIARVFQVPPHLVDPGPSTYGRAHEELMVAWKSLWNGNRPKGKIL